MIVQLHGYIKNQFLVLLKWVNCMLCVLYLNKAIIKEDQQRLVQYRGANNHKEWSPCLGLKGPGGEQYGEFYLPGETPQTLTFTRRKGCRDMCLDLTPFLFDFLLTRPT